MMRNSIFTLTLSAVLLLLSPDLRAQDGEIRAEFYDNREWLYTGDRAYARVTADGNGGGELHIEVTPSSGAFKYFAESHAVIVLTDSTGGIIEGHDVTGTAMGSSFNVDTRHVETRKPVNGDDFRLAVYAFFFHKFCGWSMGFDRNLEGNNGCFQSSLERELKEFTNNITGQLRKIEVSVGARFEVMGWQGVRLR